MAQVFYVLSGRNGVLISPDHEEILRCPKYFQTPRREQMVTGYQRTQKYAQQHLTRICPEQCTIPDPIPIREIITVNKLMGKMTSRKRKP